MVKDEKCWIIENGSRITPVEIISITGNLILIKMESGKTLRLPKHRIFDSEEKAEETLKRRNLVQKKKTQYDYMN